VIEAFTRKADGSVVPADPGDFVTQDGAVGAAMSFADVKVHQIPFRDLSVGDTTVLTVRSTEKEHYIPGQYSHPMVLAPSAARRTFDVTLRAPATLEIRHDEQQLAYEEAKAGDEIVRHWSGTAEPITAEEKDVADLAFAFPGLRYSVISIRPWRSAASTTRRAGIWTSLSCACRARARGSRASRGSASRTT
jgi:hypothetical protein